MVGFEYFSLSFLHSPPLHPPMGNLVLISIKVIITAAPLETTKNRSQESSRVDAVSNNVCATTKKPFINPVINVD